MAIQGAPRRLRGQNPNAPQIPTFSPNDFGGQLGNMQIGNMGGLMGSQPMANTINNKQVQGNMGGGLRSGGPQAPIPITDANREEMARLQREKAEQRRLSRLENRNGQPMGMDQPMPAQPMPAMMPSKGGMPVAQFNPQPVPPIQSPSFTPSRQIRSPLGPRNMRYGR